MHIFLGSFEALFKPAYLCDIFEAYFLAHIPGVLESLDLVECRFHFDEQLFAMRGVFVAFKRLEEQGIQVGFNNSMEDFFHGLNSRLEQTRHKVY